MKNVTIEKHSIENVIGFARVLKGAVSFKDSGIENINDTYRGQIYTKDDETKFAYIKDLKPKELANEIMATSLGKVLGLPIPDAYIALVEGDDMPIKNAPKSSNGYIVFASSDANVDSVSSILSTQNFSSEAIRRIVEALLKDGGLASFYEFDAWSANIDRHPGNFLISGEGKFWLIDHGFCFTGPDWVPTDLDANYVYINKLQSWVTPSLSSKEIDSIVSSLGSLLASVSNVDIKAVGEACMIRPLIGDVDFEALIYFLEQRAPNVQGFATQALGRLA